MPLFENRDDGRRRLRWTTSPPLTLAEVLAQFDADITLGVWRYGLLVDLRMAILPPEERDPLFESIAELVAEHGPHGPIALVAKKVESVAAAQLYSTRSSDVGLECEVFSAINQAHHWLDHRMR